MKHARTAWRIVGWLLLIAWPPVLIELCVDYLFHIEKEFPSIFFLIIPYMEFITVPLTCLAGLIALWKGLRSAFRLLRNNRLPGLSGRDNQQSRQSQTAPTNSCRRSR
jgi:hypothetical protein